MHVRAPESRPVSLEAVRTPPTPVSTPVAAPKLDTLTMKPVPLEHVADCAKAWEHSLLVRVGDAQLSGAVDAVFAHHAKAGFLAPRTAGMQRLTGIGMDGQLDVQLAPNRDKVPLVEVGHPENKSCALCQPQFPDERGLSWRDYNVWPNAFPYVPESEQHVVITAARHVGQQYSAKILSDMMDYQRAASADAPVTMHYNGIAGNSQFHLHWHATREHLPLQRLLDTGKLPLNRLHQGAQGSVDTFDHGFYSGLLVTGDKGYVTRWATQVIAKLDKDPLTRGAYNLLLLHPKDGQARLVIVPRRADNLKPSVGEFGKVGFGAFTFGGTIVVPKDSIPASFGADVTQAARQTAVHPEELPWLQDLAREPGHPMLRAVTQARQNA